MKLPRSMELIEKYANCPECGSDKIGNGAGTLYIDDYEFTRSCKCGWIAKEKDIEKLEQDIAAIKANIPNAFNATEKQTMRSQIRRLEFKLKQLR